MADKLGNEIDFSPVIAGKKTHYKILLNGVFWGILLDAEFTWCLVGPEKGTRHFGTFKQAEDYIISKIG